MFPSNTLLCKGFFTFWTPQPSKLAGLDGTLAKYGKLAPRRQIMRAALAGKLAPDPAEL
jgi:hypothetical protein